MTELGSMGCLVCDGSGVGAFARPCTACGGTGRVAVKFRADVAAASERLTDGELQVFINADSDGRGTIANMARELLALRAELDAARERVRALVYPGKGAFIQYHPNEIGYTCRYCGSAWYSNGTEYHKDDCAAKKGREFLANEDAAND